jgi:hypothetical protein
MLPKVLRMNPVVALRAVPPGSNNVVSPVLVNAPVKCSMRYALSVEPAHRFRSVPQVKNPCIAAIVFKPVNKLN